MLLGYNTNGFAHHRLDEAVEVLAEIGYRAVAITLDHHHLDPFCPAWRANASQLRERLDRLGLQRTVETGARFLLDPRRKHQPTLISAKSADRARRVDLLCRAIDVAVELNAPVVSLWSGAADDAAGESELWRRLGDGLDAVLSRAVTAGIHLAFEPEPGMFVDTIARFAELHARRPHAHLGMTLDIGHVCCLDDGGWRQHIREWRERIWNVHIEDMRRGVHEHLMFGEGEIDFDAVLSELRGINYVGALNVELSRHSHDPVRAAQQAFDFLRAKVN